MSAALSVSNLFVSANGAAILRGVNLTVEAGGRLGLVGESGSGKSMTALSIMRLHRAPVGIQSGSIRLGETELVGASRRVLNSIRGRTVAMIYQDPASSLNPLMTIGDQIIEAITLHQRLSRPLAAVRAVELLQDVGVVAAARRLSAYPHEFSGGMRQRVMIAMALAGDPSVLLCDEPTTALDVTTQARIMALLDRLCTERAVAVLLITHDLAVASGFCDDIAVMYAGQVVESSSTQDLFARPQHPYSAALLASTLDLDADTGQPILTIAGQPPLPPEIGAGCAFRPRCRRGDTACEVGTIPQVETRSGFARCIHTAATDKSTTPTPTGQQR